MDLKVGVERALSLFHCSRVSAMPFFVGCSCGERGVSREKHQLRVKFESELKRTKAARNLAIVVGEICAGKRQIHAWRASERRIDTSCWCLLMSAHSRRWSMGWP